MSPTAMLTAPSVPAADTVISRQCVFSAPIVGSRANMAVPIPRLIGLEMVERMRTAIRQRPMISVARIKPVIDVSVKPVRPMEPRTRSKKHAAHKPIGPVIAVWSAIVGSVVEVPIRANRRHANIDGNLCRRNWSPADHGSCEKRKSDRLHRGKA
jgi:hypothetical protein